MLTGHLHLQWEAASRTPETDKREWIPNVAILTLKDGVVHMGFLELEVINFYGSTGLRVLEGVIQALESEDGVYRTYTSIPFHFLFPHFPHEPGTVLISMYRRSRL